MLISILHEKEHCQVLVLSGGSLTVQRVRVEQTTFHEGGIEPPVVPLNCAPT